METDPSNRWCRITTRLCCFLLGFAALFPNARAAVWHVRKESSGPIPDGVSWASAHSSINAALTSAAPGDEIWVAAGDYRESIEVPDGVALFGGFQGTETAREQRRWMVHRSVLRTPPRIHEASLVEPPGPLVRFGPSAGPATRLDGFHLLGNSSDIAPAIYIPGGAPVVANNVIASHSADGVVASGAIAVDQSYRVPTILPVEYFERTANWLFARHGLSVRTTNLMVWPHNQWTPEVQRLFQLAANLCDAEMPVPGSEQPRFPRVFLPRVARAAEGQGVVLAGFREVTDQSELSAIAPLELSSLADQIVPPGHIFPGKIYVGLPVVVSSRPGWPSLSEFASLSASDLVRHLEFWKSSPAATGASITNQVLQLSLENSAAVELANASRQDLDREVRIDIGLQSKAFIRVYGSTRTSLAYSNLSSAVESFSSNRWAAGATALPAFTNVFLDTNLIYHWSQQIFASLETTNSRWASYRDTSLTALESRVSVSNQLTLSITDRASGRLVDVVSLPWLGTEFSLIRTGSPPRQPGVHHSPWETAGTVLPKSARPGIQNQIAVATGDQEPSWNDYDPNYSTWGERQYAVALTRDFLGLPELPGMPLGPGQPHLTYLKAKLSPVKRSVFVSRLVATDELLHSTPEDLSREGNLGGTVEFQMGLSLGLPTLEQINFGSSFLSLGRLEDPIVLQSSPLVVISRQAFPEFQFPVGGPIHFDWLTRVHRGSPLQTVLLAPTWFSRTNRDDALALGLLQGELGVPLLPEPPARPVIVHNTFVGNDRSALWLHPSAQPVVINNLFATNSAGIDVGGPGSQALVAVNGFWNNASSVTGSPAPFSQPMPLANPAFFTRTAVDARLQAVSPARDAGSFLPLDNGWVLAEPSRWQGAAPDLGAHEVSEEDPPLLTLAAPNPPAPGQPSTPWSLDATLLAPGGAVLEASTNLVEWWPVATNTPVAGAIHWTLPDEETSALFFRVLRP